MALNENRRTAVEIRLVTRGSFDPVHFLLFPLVPPPWGTPARRESSPALSPAIGERAGLSPATSEPAGSLDWWSHAGDE